MLDSSIFIIRQPHGAAALRPAGDDAPAGFILSANNRRDRGLFIRYYLVQRDTAQPCFSDWPPPMRRRRHPLLHVHAAYSDRFVDLVREGFDAAVRLGFLRDSSLVARRICVIHGKYVASPSYIATRGAPTTPDDLEP